MLGIELTGAAAVRDRLPLGPDPRSRTARSCPRPRATRSIRSDTIEVLGADALRFALIHGTTPGNDQRFGPAKVENARNFANKLWNATRFVLGARPATIAVDAERRLPDARPPRAGRPLGPVARRRDGRAPSIARWPTSTSARSRASCTRRSGASTATGAWSSPRSASRTRIGPRPSARRPGGRSSRPSTRTCGCCTRSMPFITERLWQAHPASILGPGPAHRRALAGHDRPRLAAEAEVGALVELVRAIRNARADAKLEPAAWLPLDVYVEPELGHALEAPAAGDRAPRARPTAPPSPHPRGPPRHGGDLGRPGRDRRPGRGDRRARSRRSGRRRRRPRAAREGAGGHGAPARGGARAGSRTRRSPRRRRPPSWPGARASEAELSDQADRLRDRLGR